MEQKERSALAFASSLNESHELNRKENKEEKTKNQEDRKEDIEMGVVSSNEPKEEIMVKSVNLVKSSSANRNVLNFMKQKTVIESQVQKNEKSLAKEIMRRKLDEKEEIKKNREAKLNKMIKQMKLVGKNVVFPTYKFDERLKIHREDVSPPEEVYMAVGYDPKYDSKQKHYRRFYEDELENVQEVIPRSPFMTYKILRGQARGLSKSWFSKDTLDEAGQVTNVREVGLFKGIVTVINKEREEDFEIVKQTRIQILKENLNKISQTIFNEPFDYDYDKLVTSEGRELLHAKLQQIG